MVGRRLASWIALLAVVPLLAQPMPCCALGALIPSANGGCCLVAHDAATPNAPSETPACPNCAEAEKDSAPSSSAPSPSAPAPTDCCCFDAPEPATLPSHSTADLSIDLVSLTGWAAPELLVGGAAHVADRMPPRVLHEPPLRVLYCTWLI